MFLRIDIKSLVKTSTFQLHYLQEFESFTTRRTFLLSFSPSFYLLSSCMYACMSFLCHFSLFSHFPLLPLFFPISPRSFSLYVVLVPSTSLSVVPSSFYQALLYYARVFLGTLSSSFSPHTCNTSLTWSFMRFLTNFYFRFVVFIFFAKRRRVIYLYKFPKIYILELVLRYWYSLQRNSSTLMQAADFKIVNFISGAIRKILLMHIWNDIWGSRTWRAISRRLTRNCLGQIRLAMVKHSV